MVRRILALSFAAFVALSLLACGSDDDAGGGDGSTPSTQGTGGDPGEGTEGTGGDGEGTGGEAETVALTGELGANDDDGCVTVSDADGVVWKLLVDTSVEGVSFVFGDPTGVIVNDEGQALAGVGDQVEVEGTLTEEPPYCGGAEKTIVVTRFVDPDPASAFPTEIEGVFESANGDQCAQLRGDDGTVYELVLDSEADNVQIVNADGQQKLYTSDAQLLAEPGARFRVTGQGWVIDPSELCPEATVAFAFTAIEVIG